MVTLMESRPSPHARLPLAPGTGPRSKTGRAATRHNNHVPGLALPLSQCFLLKKMYLKLGEKRERTHKLSRKKNIIFRVLYRELLHGEKETP